MIRSRTAVSGYQFYQFQFNWTRFPRRTAFANLVVTKCSHGLPLLTRTGFGTVAGNGHWPPIATSPFTRKRKGRDKGDGKTLSRSLAGSSFPPQQVSNCGTRSGLLSDPSAVSAGGALACFCWVGFPPSLSKPQRCGKSL